jgi:hypothetical protein
MKFTTALLLVLPLAVSASPLETRFAELLFSRQSAASETDRLLFSVTLSAFLQARAAQNPSYLDWSSDSCSSSPDNPFGFPFDPACQRHDFGYRNYKAQNRFTDAGKLRIDNNFRNDLYHQCATTSAVGTCETTADVYYWAVRAFGGREAAPAADGELEAARVADPDALAKYEEALAKLRELQKEQEQEQQ